MQCIIRAWSFHVT